MIVAIDGPAGSGKSSVARVVAARRQLTLLDTGAMYRAVTLSCLENNVDCSDEAAVTGVAKHACISFVATDAGQAVLLDDRDVTEDIRTSQVDERVSAVSAIPGVRRALVALQRQMGALGDVIAEGRDVGTVVFPHADVKVFLTADPKARAHRRAAQRQGKDVAVDRNVQVDVETERSVLADLIRRDRLDSTREESPLRPAVDALHIDSSDLCLDEVVAQVLAAIDEARR